ncbi:MAG: ADOP family duplicated permease [Vicinamibacterales bacterium]
MDRIKLDVTYALRRLRSRPTFALMSVVTMALVIGAGSAVLAVVNATLVRPLPFPEAERLVSLYSMPPGETDIAMRNPLHPLDFVRFRSHLRQADAVEAFWARDRALSGEGDPESVPAARVSAGALPLLGGVPLMGRTFTEAEDRAAERLVVLSWGLWQRKFGGRASVIGETIQIDREPFQIIGVLGQSFEPAYIQSELWTPLGIHDGNLPLPGDTYLQTVARLRPGASVQQLDAEVQSLMVEVVKEGPPQTRGWTAHAITFREFQYGTRTPALLILLAASLVLALIACANLANLTLAEVMGRRGELALRAALGAGRGGGERLQVIESLFLAAAGTAAGLLLARITLPTLLALDPGVAKTLPSVGIDWRVQGSAAVLATLVSLAAGLWPLWRGIRGDLAQGVADGGRRTAGARHDRRVGRVLVGAEVALTVVLMVSSALLLSAFQRVSTLNPGFDPRNVLGGQIRLAPNPAATEATRAAFVQQVVERVRALPGVVDAGVTLNSFIPGFFMITTVQIEGRPAPGAAAGYFVQLRRISPGYFKTMRIRQRLGRTFTEQDGTDAPKVAVVSQAFADQFWPGEDPLGRRVHRGTLWFTVIGVVDDVRDVSLSQAEQPTFYLAYAQSNNQTAPISLVVRTAGSPLGVAQAVRAAVFAVDPGQPIDHVLTLEDFLAASAGPERFRGMLLVIFALLALVLSAVGIYGVTARSAGQRTREMGVRLALGAEPSQVWRLIVGEGLRSVIAGMVVGGVAAAGAAALVTRWLPGTQFESPQLMAAAGVLLAIVALAATALPARRVLRADPLAALRSE